MIEACLTLSLRRDIIAWLSLFHYRLEQVGAPGINTKTKTDTTDTSNKMENRVSHKSLLHLY